MLCSHSLVLFPMDPWVSVHCHWRNGISTFFGAWRCHAVAPGGCEHFKPTCPAAGLLTLPRGELRSHRGRRGVTQWVPPREGHGDVLPCVNVRCPGTSTPSGDQGHPAGRCPAFSRAVLCRAVQEEGCCPGQRGRHRAPAVAWCWWHAGPASPKLALGTAALGIPDSKPLLKPSQMSVEAFFSDSHHLGSLGRDRDLQGCYSQPEQPPDKQKNSLENTTRVIQSICSPKKPSKQHSHPLPAFSACHFSLLK